MQIFCKPFYSRSLSFPCKTEPRCVSSGEILVTGLPSFSRVTNGTLLWEGTRSEHFGCCLFVQTPWFRPLTKHVTISHCFTRTIHLMQFSSGPPFFVEVRSNSSTLSKFTFHQPLPRRPPTETVSMNHCLNPVGVRKMPAPSTPDKYPTR